MRIGEYVQVVKGVHKGRVGVITQTLFGEYHVRFNTKEIYWFDGDEIKIKEFII